MWSWMCGRPLKYVRPTRGHSFKEDLFLPILTVISYQQFLNECKDFLPSSPLHAGILSGLPWFWTCSQNHCEFICATSCLIDSGKHYFLVSIHLFWLLESSYFLFYNNPRVLARGGVILMSHLGPSIPQSLILCFWSVVSVSAISHTPYTSGSDGLWEMR